MRVSLKTLLATLALATLTVALSTTVARGLGDSDDAAGEPKAAAAELQDADSAGETLPSDEPSLSDEADVGIDDQEDSHGTSDATIEEEGSANLSSEKFADVGEQLDAKLHAFDVRAQELLGASSTPQGAARKAAISRWQANRAERRFLQNQLANAYMVYQMTMMQQRDPGIIERMIEEAVSASPRLQQLQMQMLWLNTQIDQLRVSTGNRQSSAVARLEEKKQQVAQQMQQLETQERQRLKSDFEAQPSLMLKLLSEQWDVQRQVYGARIAKLDAEAEEIANELAELTKEHEELQALLEDLKDLSAQLKELSRTLEKTVPDAGSNNGPPAGDAPPEDPGSNARSQMDGLEGSTSGAPSNSADGDIAKSADEVISNDQGMQEDDTLRKELERQSAELSRQRQEYFELAEKLGGSSDPNLNFEVNTALSRWRANRAERRLIATELANAELVDADESELKAGQARLEALDREAERIRDEIRKLTNQNAELIQRQEELERLAERVEALGQSLKSGQEGSRGPDRPDEGNETGAADTPVPTAEVKLLDGQELVALASGTELILVLDSRTPRIQVNEPDVVTVTALSADRIQLEGKQPGEATINLWNDSGAVRTVAVLVYETIPDQLDVGSRRTTAVEEAVGEIGINETAWESLGMRLIEAEHADLRNFRGGLRVSAVKEGGPADAAKIRKGDMLVGLRQWEVKSLADLDYVLDRVLADGEHEVKFYVVRDGHILYGRLRPISVSDETEPPESESPIGQTDERLLNDTSINSDAGVAGTAVTDRKLTYDGKNFAHWKTVWRTELKTERRTEAIRALATFGAHGYGREAAETILDVVRNYDTQNVRGNQPEFALIQAAWEAFSGGGVRIPLDDGLAVLTERMTGGDQRLTAFATRVIGELPTSDPAVPAHVLKFAKGDSTPLRIAANHKLRHMYDHVDGQTREQIIDAFRSSIAAEEKYIALTGLWGLYPVLRNDYGPTSAAREGVRVGYVPELMQALRHDDAKVRLAATEAFRHLGERAEEAVPELREMVQTLPPDQGYYAVFVLGKIGPAAAEAAPDVVELLQEAENEAARERIVEALAAMKAAPQVVFEHYLGGDPRKALEHMDNVVIPRLATAYGRAAEPAAPQVAPFLLNSDASVRHTAVLVLQTITGSHEFAEQYLKRLVTQLPSSDSSEQAERSLEVLRRIEELREQQRSESRAPSGGVGIHEDVLRAR